LRRLIHHLQAEGGELDADSFNEKLGPTFGAGLSKAALAQLFMKIDADCGGTVDWFGMCPSRVPMRSKDTAGVNDLIPLEVAITIVSA